MSTPERQQDPGEHGYGGVKQEVPEAIDDDDTEVDDHPRIPPDLEEGEPGTGDES